MASMKEQIESIERKLDEVEQKINSLESKGGTSGMTFQQVLLLEMSKHVNLNNKPAYEAKRIKDAADELIKQWGVE